MLLFSATVSAAGGENQLLVAISSDETGLSTYSPFEANFTNEAWSLIYETLVTQTLEGRFVPRLATEWHVSADGLTWDFFLREGVRFHDGTPFDAASVAWTVERLRSTASGLLVEMIDDVIVNGKLHVKFHLSRPSPSLLYNLSLPLIVFPSPAAVEKLGSAYGIRSAVGTGPYRLESFKVGKETKLVRNAEYTWGGSLTSNPGPASIERITFKEISDESTLFLDLKTGSLDLVLEVPPIFRELIRGLQNVSLESIVGQNNWHVVMNSQIEPLKDKRVRKAISFAINQNLLVNALFRGSGVPADTYLTPAMKENDVAAQYRLGYDRALSERLLAASGWLPTKGGYRYKNGERLELELWTRNKTEFRRVAEVIQAQLGDVGIAVKIVQFDPSTIRSQYGKGVHQLALRSYGYNSADILEWFFNSDRLGYPNAAMWKDQRSDELMNNAMDAQTSQARQAAFMEYHRYLLSQYLWAPIYWPNDNIAYRSDRVSIPALQTFDILNPAVLDMRILQ